MKSRPAGAQRLKFFCVKETSSWLSFKHKNYKQNLGLLKSEIQLSSTLVI